MRSEQVAILPAEMRGLRNDLRELDDSKLREVIAVLDDAAVPAANRAILDPVRARIGGLNMERPLRFTRLLFLPLDPLIVPARGWRPDQPAVPRTVLAPLARVVREAIGGVARYVDQVIAGRSTGAVNEITAGGEALWPSAGEALAAAAAPADWTETTGLPVPAFAPLAKAIAMVLRRAPELRRLVRDADIGALAPSEAIVTNILTGIHHEPALGCAMIARLILVGAPRATSLLRRIAQAAGDTRSRANLTEAMAQGIEDALSNMETGNAIGQGGPAELAREVRGIATLLREIEHDSGGAKHRSRLKTIRDRLSTECQSRFADGLRTGLVAPLTTAAAPMDSSGQIQLEVQARGLRALETVARQLGGPASYDALLTRAAQTVRQAAAAGNLTPIRQYRLLEIISGPEAAEALYNAEAKGRGGTAR